MRRFKALEAIGYLQKVRVGPGGFAFGSGPAAAIRANDAYLFGCCEPLDGLRDEELELVYERVDGVLLELEAYEMFGAGPIKGRVRKRVKAAGESKRRFRRLVSGCYLGRDMVGYLMVLGWGGVGEDGAVSPKARREVVKRHIERAVTQDTSGVIGVVTPHLRAIQLEMDKRGIDYFCRYDW
jgi:hypothetical protein